MVVAMEPERIQQSVREVIGSLPAGITLVAAGKTRTPEELRAAIEGGVTVIGHNYVQEAEASITAVGRGVRWHMIGHLQRNKAARAVELFDMIETVDSARLGRALEKACAATGKVMPVLVEVNSGEESSKYGADPDDVPALVEELAGLEHLRVEGLMTMGPFSPDPEKSRPPFQLTQKLFERIRDLDLPGVHMRHLSMGMSDSYRVAIEEGATLVRIGTRLFGPR